jgi:hypothetical protein
LEKNVKGTAQKQEKHLTGGAAPVTQHRLVPFSQPKIDGPSEIFRWNASMCLNGGQGSSCRHYERHHRPLNAPSGGCIFVAEDVGCLP